MAKIQMKTPLVEMDGDEMTRIIWKMIKDILLTPYIDLKTEYYDLGLEHRNETNDQVTVDSANATKKYGVAVKCATITPNAARMTEYNLKEMWKSPNGTIRAMLDGTVFRTPILVKGITPYIPTWTKPITIARHAYGDIYKNVEMQVKAGSKAELVCTDKDGKETRELIYDFSNEDGIIQGVHNRDESIASFAKACFNYALDMKKDIWFATKDTISKKYDHTFKDIFAEIFEAEYKEKFDEAGITPEDIKTLKDIEKIPFTTKDDLRAAYPFGLFAVPYEEIVEIHASSGTSGKPTVTGYTKEDLDIWSECIARGLGMVGVEKEYILQNAFGYGLFTGGFGIHHGAQKFGAITVPISAGNTKRQLETMKDFQSDVITCTPSYAMYLGESLENSDINLEDINLKIGIHGAEMWTEEMRHKIEDTLNIKAYNIYGLTEIMGPGVAQECVEQNGMHIQDDHFYPEIINPKTGETLPAGQKGELVLTTLTKTGIPILRFRTKDLTSLIIEQCACGRTSVKMSRITGRSDDMLKIRGVMVFPSQIEKALLKIKGASPNYLIKVTRPDTLDEVEVKVEATKELFSDEMKEMEKTEAMIVKSIKSETGLRVNVTLCEPESLPRSEGKSVRVIDERNFE